MCHLFGGVMCQAGLNGDAVTLGMKDPSADHAARVSWKYACSRSITGTASYLCKPTTHMCLPTGTYHDMTLLGRAQRSRGGGLHIGSPLPSLGRIVGGVSKWCVCPRLLDRGGMARVPG